MPNPGFQPGARDHDLARLVDHTVKQLGAHAHTLIGQLTRRRQRRKRLGIDLHGRRWLGHACGLLERFSRGYILSSHGRSFRQTQGLLGHGAQGVKVGLNRIETGQQRLQLKRLQGLAAQVLNGRFHAVSHLAHSHGARQTGTALQGVQHAQHFAASGQIVRVCGPLPKRIGELGQQFQRLFFKNREEVHVQQINSVDVVVVRIDHSLRHG